MLNKNIETFIGCENNYSSAEIALFGAPFDGTASFRPGARFAPKAIRADSFGIETYSPYQNKDLNELKIFDGGDIELPFGNTKKVLSMIEDHATALISDGKLPVMIGGEHLITLGAVRAAIKKFPNLHIIHFDAHADLRDQYLGETLSHATVMRRICEKLGDAKIYQFGIRSGEASEFEFSNAHTVMQKFNLEGFASKIKPLFGKPIYISIDLDVLDPSIFPGTGTPEAGGVTFNELLYAIISLSPLHIIGCDLTELSPTCDHSGVSTLVACKILRELLLTIGGK
ncbi:MAG: agmatinase [Oscillospiraceae bacterium]|jgi:agmatinase|nr:agmatinase [Oscillospiraceae bacterium]